jgi:hypothetical protein
MGIGEGHPVHNNPGAEQQNTMAGLGSLGIWLLKRILPTHPRDQDGYAALS